MAGDRGKGKAVAESSSNPKSRKIKKRKVVIQEEEEEDDIMQTPKPDWDSGPLSAQDETWQPELFRDQLNTLTNKREAFMCERDVTHYQFEPFGVIDKFNALGWEEALRGHDGGIVMNCLEEIEEWVSTLKLNCVDGKPQLTEIVGTVGGVPVPMNFTTLKEITNFDSKPSKRYIFPSLDDLYHKPNGHDSWDMMVQDLFVRHSPDGVLWRENLKIEAKLLLVIVQQNVIPRRGAKQEVRYTEVPILYSLMHGRPLIPYRYLVIYNIWLTRENVKRKFIPHCRTIAGLLRRHGVIPVENQIVRRSPKLEINHLGSNWEYKTSERYLKLKSAHQRWRVLKPDARELEPGEDDEPVSESEAESEDDDYQDAPGARGGVDVGVDTGGAGPSGGVHGTAVPFDYATRNFDPNWAHQGSMEEVIRNTRPDAYYQWPDLTRVAYDHSTFIGASHERALKKKSDQDEEWNRAHAYAFQQEINDRYYDDLHKRGHNSWLAGQQFVEDPMIIDYSSHPPYDGTNYEHEPPVHHSRYVDPRRAEQGSSQQQQQDALNFDRFKDAVNSIFGPPQPRYY